MLSIYKPLKNNWKVEEDSAVSAEQQIFERVNSEDFYTSCKGYPIIKSEELIGCLGNPIPEPVFESANPL